MATWWTVGADANDPQRLAAFWARALGYVPEPGFDGPDNASIVDPDGRGPAIGFLRVPEPTTAKSRFHLDVRVLGDADLVEAGATVVREEWYGEGVLGHVVLLDPEGNEFCCA